MLKYTKNKIDWFPSFDPVRRPIIFCSYSIRYYSGTTATIYTVIPLRTYTVESKFYISVRRYF